MMVYDAILFDLDNTLYDYNAYWRERLAWSLEPVQAAYPHMDMDALIERTICECVYAAHFPEFLQRAGVEDTGVCMLAQERYRINDFTRLTLYPDALHVLTTLRCRYRLGLITNGPVRTQRPKIEQFGLEPFMDPMIISGEVGFAKPDPAIFYLALQRLAIAPARALYVGDSQQSDLVGAHAAGIDFVWMNPHHHSLRADMPAPLACITHLAGLLELFL
jgi:putative hydrolase of the HAD superfamily